jgi:hypothetical protein
VFGVVINMVTLYEIPKLDLPRIIRPERP